MQTISSIIKFIEDKVIKNEPISPAFYCEAAIRIVALKGELDNEIALLESQLINIEAELLQQDITSAKAKVLAKSKIDYKKLLELKAKANRINEFIMLSKRRAIIQDI